jgi:hypothetical protein
MTGLLPAQDVRDLLHQLMLGLSRMQIYTVISEAEVNQEDKIAYTAFIPKAVGMIRSMLSFEKSINKDPAHDVGPEVEDDFFVKLDEAFAGATTVSSDDFLAKLEGCKIVDARELVSAKLLLGGYPDPSAIPVEEAKSQIWALVKSMRRQKA